MMNKWHIRLSCVQKTSSLHPLIHPSYIAMLRSHDDLVAAPVHSTWLWPRMLLAAFHVTLVALRYAARLIITLFHLEIICP